MRKQIAGLGGITVAVVADLWSKTTVFQLYPFAYKTGVFAVLYFLPVYNTGAAWSIGASQGSLVTGASLALCMFTLFEFFRRPTLVWALICAGGLANTCDRILIGAVRDFIALSYGGYTFPIFNLADCYLSLGIFLLLCQQYLGNAHRHIVLGDR